MARGKRQSAGCLFLTHIKSTEVLDRFDGMAEPFSEAQLADALREAIKQEPLTSPEDLAAVVAEQFAFSVVPDYPQRVTGWGSYYRPMMTGNKDDGSPFEWPSVAELNADIVSYWERRLGEAHHPLLRARYADLLWDLSKLVTGKPCDVRIAWQAIDFAIQAVELGAYKYPTQAIERLERALAISLSVGHDQRTTHARDAMIRLEDKIADDDHAGLWGFCFDNLVENNKVPLEDDQRSKIISDLEQRLSRLYDRCRQDSSPDPFTVEAVATRLAKYYRRVNSASDVRRVLTTYRNAFVSAAEKAEPMVAQTWLKKVYEVLFQHGLKEEALGIEPLLRDYGKRSLEDMKTVSAEVAIPKKELTRFLASMTAGSLEECLTRLAVQFLPDPKRTEKQILEMAKRAPLQALVPHMIVDNEGRPVAQIGPVEDDLEGHVALQLGRDMQVNSRFLGMILQALQERGELTVDGALEIIKKCPLFRVERLPLVASGIRAYLAGDHASAIHLLIPQIEAALRDLVVMSGGQSYRPGRTGDLRLKTLDEILREPVIGKVFSDRGAVYLRVLLTDPRGWNLRNEVMHGLLSADRYTSMMSDRILHVLALLSLARESAPGDGGPGHEP